MRGTEDVKAWAIALSPAEDNRPSATLIVWNNDSEGAREDWIRTSELAFAAVLDWGRRQPGPVRAQLFATADGRGLYEREGFAASTWPMLGMDLT